MSGQLVAVGDAGVGQAVGQQQGAVDALLVEVSGDLLGAAEPALAEVGLVAGVDPTEERDCVVLGLGGRQGGRDDDVDLIVVDDDGEAVVRVKAGDRLDHSLLRQGDLLAGHGA